MTTIFVLFSALAIVAGVVVVAELRLAKAKLEYLSRSTDEDRKNASQDIFQKIEGYRNDFPDAG
jgi:cell division protein ZapA (FtsZ GTPase activity inhibitor)